MNWQDFHTIITRLTKQSTIPKLNAVGLSTIKLFLGNSSYHVMLNHSIKSSDSLDLVYVHSEQPLSSEESMLIKKLGASSWGYDNMFEITDHYCFVVTSQNHCFVLITVRKDDKIVEGKILEVLKTYVTVWSGLLDTLYFYQRDYLTGLLNRGILIDAINGNAFDSNVFEDGTEEKPPLERRLDHQLDETHAIALIDIDNFKQINDRWGHSIGDEVLIKLASLMELSFRDHDLLCRYGGEEFAVYLRFITKRNCEEILQRFCQRVAESVFPKVGHVTVTIGYSLTYPGVLASELVDRADKALYFGKENGKNQVNSAEEHIEMINSGIVLDAGEIDLF